VDADFLRNVFRDGILLYGKMLVTPEGLRLKPYILLTYDISSKSKSIKVKISRMVHGYRGSRTIKGKKYEYEYKGLISTYGARIISPSTLILPRAEASEFAETLKEHGAKVETLEVWQ
jgi:hypothetical protein